MNNPLMQMVGLLQSGGNPMQMLQHMAMQNPQAAQAMKMIRGKSPQELRQMAENMARERGTTLDAVAQSLGLTIPK